MAFNRRLDQIFPGMGHSLRNDSSFLQTGVSLSGNSQTSTVHPASGVFAPTIGAGRMRVKIYNGGGTSPTLTDFVVTATDGTNTLVLPQSVLHPTVAISLNAGSWFDIIFDFMFDIATTGAGGASAGQLSGTIGGANAFTVKVTFGGTSPTGTMDIDLCPLI